MGSGDGWRGGVVGLLFLRGALGVGGAFPGDEFAGVAGVFVLDGGVEAADHTLGGGEEGLDGGGAFDAFEVVADFAGVAGIEGIAVGAEVLDEVGGEFVGDEFGAERGLGGELGRGFTAVCDEGGVVFEKFRRESAWVVTGFSTEVPGWR